MIHLIDKDEAIAKIKSKINEVNEKAASYSSNSEHDYLYKIEEGVYKDSISIINSLEVKEVGDNSLEKFKSLQHINRDINKTMQDWGYAPNLYFFDGSWHVSWISCEEGDSIKDFTADTAEEAIDKACNWFHSTFCNN